MRNRAIRNCAVTRVLVVFALGALFVAAPGITRAGITERVSIASDGTQGDGPSWEPSVNADGRFVAFWSSASNLIDDGTNGSVDVFVHDRETGRTERVSVASDGNQGNSSSAYPAISADGRFVAFHSLASNLISDDTNGSSDIFVHDRQTGQTTRVSVASTGAEGNGSSYDPCISGDGRFVAFYSYASNLVEEDTNGRRDVFVHDLHTGQTERVSVTSDGTEGNKDSGTYGFSISAHGQFVAFHSLASNLISDDTNGSSDIFVHDRQTGQTTRVSVASDGTQGNDMSRKASISADGRFVAFLSYADNLVSGDTNGQTDIFVHDRETGQTERISVASDGAQANRESQAASISADGRFVAFGSHASNLVADDTNGRKDVFVHDRQTRKTTCASVASDGTQGNSYSRNPSISADGRFVAFESVAGNLISGDTNGNYDIFIHDRGMALTVTVSGSGTGTVELSPPGAVYDEGTTVTLTAATSPGSFFVRWEGDLAGWANPTTILMDANKNVVAHFIYPQLSVLSAPIGGVAITGTRAGTTPYSADCDLHEVVALTAPETVSAGGKTYYFELWFVDNVSVPPSEGRPFNEVEVRMDDQHTVLAQYGWRLPGDYNDDCTVNILDLLFVRNRLQTKCSE